MLLFFCLWIYPDNLAYQQFIILLAPLLITAWISYASEEAYPYAQHVKQIKEYLYPDSHPDPQCLPTYSSNWNTVAGSSISAFSDALLCLCVLRGGVGGCVWGVERQSHEGGNFCMYLSVLVVFILWILCPVDQSCCFWTVCLLPLRSTLLVFSFHMPNLGRWHTAICVPTVSPCVSTHSCGISFTNQRVVHRFQWRHMLTATADRYFCKC